MVAVDTRFARASSPSLRITVERRRRGEGNHSRRPRGRAVMFLGANDGEVATAQFRGLDGQPEIVIAMVVLSLHVPALLRGDAARPKARLRSARGSRTAACFGWLVLRTAHASDGSCLGAASLPKASTWEGRVDASPGARSVTCAWHGVAQRALVSFLAQRLASRQVKARRIDSGDGMTGVGELAIDAPARSACMCWASRSHACDGPTCFLLVTTCCRRVP